MAVFTHGGAFGAIVAHAADAALTAVKAANPCGDLCLVVRCCVDLPAALRDPGPGCGASDRAQRQHLRPGRR
ncbi:hypothetical protein GCM10025771_21830 [Niveibacterium umoris]